MLALLVAAQPDTVRMCAGESVMLSIPAGRTNPDWGADFATQFRFDDAVTVGPSGSRDYVVASQRPPGPNLVLNGGFAQYRTGFTSEYTYADEASGAGGTYGIVAEPDAFNPDFNPCADIDRLPDDPGTMLVFNLGPPATRVLYRQTVSVAAATDYRVVGSALALTPGPAPTLVVSIDGVELGTRALVSPIPDLDRACPWTQYSYRYRSAAAGEVTLEVRALAPVVGQGIALDGLLIAEEFPPAYDTLRVEVLASRVDTVSLPTRCAGEGFVWEGAGLERDTLVCRVVTDVNGCDSGACLAVTFFDATDVRVVAEDPHCAGAADGGISLSPVRGDRPLDIRWEDDSPAGAVRPDLPAGRYGFSVSDVASGCAVVGTVQLADPPALAWSGVAVTPTSCPSSADGIVVAAARGGRGGITLTTAVDSLETPADRLPAGEVVLTARDSLGCTLDTTLLIVVRADSVTLRIAGPFQLQAGALGTYRLTGAGADTGAIRWSFAGEVLERFAGRAAIAFAPPRSGLLTATSGAATDDPACAKTASVAVTITVAGYFPTAFSPNGDGRNDVFALAPDPTVAAVESLGIYDRWGVLVFRTAGCAPQTDPLACGWSGWVKGRDEAPSGVYTYVATLRLVGDVVLGVNGQLTLVR